MAVFTIIKKKDLEVFLKKYNLGNLYEYEGILEGVENTNYKIKTTIDTYILTIFEKRVNLKDIPFFIDLQKYLTNKKIKCPVPIEGKNKKFIQKINNK